eukprot:6190049-Pleurochrysis_carterae.AAC.1
MMNSYVVMPRQISPQWKRSSCRRAEWYQVWVRQGIVAAKTLRDMVTNSTEHNSRPRLRFAIRGRQVTDTSTAAWSA